MFQDYCTHPIHQTSARATLAFGIGMLKAVLKDHECSSGDDIEEAIAKVWDEFTFDEVQSVFHNWMSRLAWIIENG
jgi:translation elongation factor EF-1beta